MKKKIKIIIYFLALGSIAWYFHVSENNQVAMVVPKQNVMDEGKVKQASVEVLNKDIKVDEIEGDTHFDQYLNTLPTAEDFKTLSYDEIHHSPEIIKNGGAVVGRIHSEAQEDVSKRVSAMNFFKSCVEDHKVVPAIRAVCLKKIYKLIPEWKMPLLLAEERISKEVSDLAMKIP